LADCGCVNSCDSLETPATQCSDGLDNDGDGLKDYPADCGCENRCDSTETPNPSRECNDGIDNDGDGLIDLADTNCVNMCDDLELFVCMYKPGDFNGTGAINLADIIGLVGHVFKSAPAPNPRCRGDANGDGKLNLTDVVYLVNYVFKAGPDPIPSDVCCLPI